MTFEIHEDVIDQILKMFDEDDDTRCYCCPMSGDCTEDKACSDILWRYIKARAEKGSF